MTQFARRAVQGIVEEEVIKRGLSVASGVVQNPEMASGLQHGDEERLIPPLQAILRQSQALYAVALDSSGRVLGHTDVSEVGKIYGDSLTAAALRAQTPIAQRTQVEGAAAVDIAVPVWDVRRGNAEEEFLLLGGEGGDKTRLGTLRFVLPLADALETGREISKTLFWIIAVGSGTVLALILFFARKLIQPIHLLARATERLGRGRLGEIVAVQSGDEIGDLARSFNRMSMDLAQTTVSQGFLNTILENMQDALIVTDPQGYIRMTNKSACDLLSCAAKVLRGQNAFDYFVLDYPGSGGADVAQVVGQHPIYNARGHVIIEAETIPVLVSVSRFGDVDERETGLIVTARDITEWQQMEEAREEAERELEAQKALAMRSDRLRSLGEMAAGMAHELNQPLMGVRGLAEHILIGIERGWELTQEKLKERANLIVEQADRMVHIIEHVRLFAREAGKPELSSVQINEVVQAGVDMLGVQFRSHGVELVCDLQENLPPVSANPFSLEEVVLNLLNNARDAVLERFGHGEVDLHGRVVVRTAGEGDAVRIDVEDNGVGIPEEVMGRVFDPFFTTKEPDKGTGLGLAICKAIVEDFDGSMQIQSVPGAGAEISVILPAGV